MASREARAAGNVKLQPRGSEHLGRHSRTCELDYGGASSAGLRSVSDPLTDISAFPQVVMEKEGRSLVSSSCPIEAKITETVRNVYSWSNNTVITAQIKLICYPMALQHVQTFSRESNI